MLAIVSNIRCLVLLLCVLSATPNEYVVLCKKIKKQQNDLGWWGRNAQTLLQLHVLCVSVRIIVTCLGEVGWNKPVQTPRIILLEWHSLSKDSFLSHFFSRQFQMHHVRLWNQGKWSRYLSRNNLTTKFVSIPTSTPHSNHCQNTVHWHHTHVTDTLLKLLTEHSPLTEV